MSQKYTSIFLTGATGYIGGSVLARLLTHPKSSSFKTTVLVRSQEKASKLSSAAGVNATIGSYSDLGLLKRLAGDADVVFACADADDLDAAKAILEGMRQRYQQTGKAPALIHTSGTGVLADDAKGMHSSDVIYSDLDIAHLETLAPTQPHREVDLAIVEADKQGYVKTYIILPSTIYGIASGPLVDLGVQNAHSQQIPRLVQVALNRGQGGMVGEGKNMWPNVHIDEVADLYLTLLDAALSSDPTAAHGRSGFYFGENGEHTLYSIGEKIAQILFNMDKGHSPIPTTFSAEDMSKYFPNGTSLGTNSRCRGDRSRSVGWAPKKRTKDMLGSIKEEVETLVTGMI